MSIIFSNFQAQVSLNYFHHPFSFIQLGSIRHLESVEDILKQKLGALNWVYKANDYQFRNLKKNYQVIFYISSFIKFIKIKIDFNILKYIK